MLDDGRPQPVHERQHVVDIVHGEEVGADGLLGGQMVDIGTGDAEPARVLRPTACTSTVGLDWGEGFGVA